MARAVTDTRHYSDIADAIRAKNSGSETYRPSEMAAAIEAIQTGVDTSADTVTAETLRKGYTAHDKSGALITGTLEVETTPVGTVIYYAGKAAPSGYLACDGTVYNISAYPELAAFFQTNYGSKNYWGGNGSTTFAVPNWQGEFFRAAGTNSRENQGSGAGVGVHQDGTTIPTINSVPNGTSIVARKSNTTTSNYVKNADSSQSETLNFAKANSSWGTGTTLLPDNYTTRPTNTSLLVCIKH